MRSGAASLWPRRYAALVGVVLLVTLGPVVRSVISGSICNWSLMNAQLCIPLGPPSGRLT